MTDLTSLAAKARAATPGPWRYDDSDGSIGSVHEDHWQTVAFAEIGRHDEFPRISIGENDASYIAAASPDVVLGLIDRIRELEAGLEEALDMWRDEVGGCKPGEDDDYDRLRKLQGGH